MAIRFRSKGSEALRRVLGTQWEKARRIGVDQGAVSLWGNGERSPRRCHRRTMAKLWGIDFCWWDEPFDPKVADAPPAPPPA